MRALLLNIYMHPFMLQKVMAKLLVIKLYNISTHACHSKYKSIRLQALCKFVF